jgi:hypothetical protein
VPRSYEPAFAPLLIVIVMVLDAPGGIYTGWKTPLPRFEHSHAFPVEVVTCVSKAIVTAFTVAVARPAGAPALPYGPISVGTSAHSPG